MKTSTKRVLIGGGAVTVAIGSVLAGASVTSASIENPEAAEPEMVIEQVAQDADGGWYSCRVDVEDGQFGVAVAETEVGTAPIEVPGGADSGVVVASGTVSAVELSEGDLEAMFEATPGAEGAIAVEVFDGVAVGGASVDAAGEVGDIAWAVPTDDALKAAGVEVEMPEPADIRPGTDAECEALLGS